MSSEFRPRELSKDSSLRLPDEDLGEPTPVTRERVLAAGACVVTVLAASALLLWAQGLPLPRDVASTLASLALTASLHLAGQVYRRVLTRLDPTQVKARVSPRRTRRQEVRDAVVAALFAVGVLVVSVITHSWAGALWVVVLVVVTLVHTRRARRLP